VKLQPDGVYVWNYKHPWCQVVYVCLERCEAETVRWKKRVPGYKLFVTEVVGAGAWGMKEGQILVVPEEANVTVGVKRLA
jgi:hypothetical protein